MPPFLSIIIPLFNKQYHILKTINSVLSQECADYEIVIVDDGSTDNSAKVVESILDSHIRLFRKKNGGPSAARNYGVRMAKGEWVLFLDADDTLEKGVINTLHELSSSHKGYSVFCCNHYVEDSDGRYLYSDKYKEGLVRRPFFDWCQGRLMPRAGAAMFRREILVSHPFDERLHRYEDAEHLFSIMREERIYRSQIPIMTYNLSTSASSLPCKDINDDFIGHLSLTKKSFWEQYALYQLFLQGCEIYPREMNRLYKGQFDKKKFKVANYIMNYKKTHNKRNPLRFIKSCIKKVFRKIIIISYPEINLLQKDYNWWFIGEDLCDVQKGKQVMIGSPSHIRESKIGDYTYIAMNSFISMTTIGKYCSIGPNLVCGWGIHPTNGISTAPMFYSTMKQNGMTLSAVDKIEERIPIVIGNDVFIGANVTILDGVTIGDGAVIGAGAVVSKDIPPYAIAVGCPIRIIKYRFTEERISALQRLKWWEFDDDKLREVEQYFFDVDGFIELNKKDGIEK